MSTQLKPNVIERGCPKDQGDLAYDIGEQVYRCDECGYTQVGLAVKPTDLVVRAGTRVALRAADSYTVADLAERWTITERAVVERVRYYGGGRSISRANPLSGSEVERIEHERARRGKKRPATHVWGQSKELPIGATPPMEERPAPSDTQEVAAVPVAPTASLVTRQLSTVGGAPAEATPSRDVTPTTRDRAPSPVESNGHQLPRPTRSRGNAVAQRLARPVSSLALKVVNARAERLRLALEHIGKLTEADRDPTPEQLAIDAIVQYALAVDDLGVD